MFLLSVSDYEDADDDFRAGMDEQVDALSEWWADDENRVSAFEVVRPHTLRGYDDVHAFVRDSGLRDADHDDVVVVYLTGHGYRGPSGTHYMLMPDDHDTPPKSPVATADVVMAALRSDAKHVLVIVNACFADAVREQVDRLAKDLPPKRARLESLAVLTTAEFDDRPRVREFATLLRRARHRLTTITEIAAPHLKVDEFLAELTYAAEEDPAEPLFHPLKVLPRSIALAPTLCLPNPGYTPQPQLVESARQQVAATSADVDYWLDRASGRPETDDPGWYFSGRQEINEAVAAFLRNGLGSLIVTGTAGSGKSAIIARVVTLSDPTFAQDPRYVEATRGQASTTPALEAIDVALLARKKSSAQLLSDLLTAITGAPHADAPVGRDRVDGDATQQLRDRVQKALLRGRNASPLGATTTTIVVDGIDEATDPTRIVSDVLAPLARLRHGDERPAVRLLLGVRSSLPANEINHSTASTESADELLDLIQRAVGADDAHIIRTDGAETIRDVSAYVVAVLQRGRGSSDADPAAVRAVADVISGHVAPSFLDARLAAARLADRDELPALTDSQWLGSLDDGTVGQLRADLADATDPEALLALLRAVAFAQGDGLPRAEVWPAIAQALSPTPVSEPDAAITALLTSRLNGYLTSQVADRRIVYRPVHERLAEILRSRPHVLSPAWDAATENPTTEQSTHRAIARALASLVSSDPNVAPPPYIRRHLIDHAASGHALLDIPPHFLPWDTGRRIRRSLGLPLPKEAVGTPFHAAAAIEAHLSDATPRDIATSLEFVNAAITSEVGESRDQDGPSISRVWSPDLVTVRYAQWPLNANILGLHTSRVTSLAAFAGPERQSLLASGSDDETVRVWDPATGEQVGAPLACESTVRSVVAFPDLNGRILLASGSEDGAVRVWDLATGEQVGSKLVGGRASVTSVVAFANQDGRTELATGSADGAVRVWDPAAGKQVARSLVNYDFPVTSLLAFAATDGRTLLTICSDRDTTLLVWDPSARKLFRSPQIGRMGPVTSVAFVAPDGRSLLATGSHDEMVLVWDPDTGEEVRRLLIGRMGPVTSVAVAASDGQTLLATGSEDGSVRVWDLATGQQVGAPLTGHTARVTSMVAFVGSDGQSLLATGSDDRTVRVWDLATTAQLRDPAIGGTDRLTSVVAFAGQDGRSLLATGSNDGMVRVWDPATGEQVRSSPNELGASVSSVVAFAGVDGRPKLAAGSWDGTVRVWDAATGDQIRTGRVAGYATPVTSVAAFADPDGRPLLAMGCRDGVVRIWDPTTGEMVLSPPIEEAYPVSLVAATVGPDGRSLLATGTDYFGRVRVWDPATGEQASSMLLGRMGPATSMVGFAAPDGQSLLAAGNRRGTVRVWDLATGERVGVPLTGHTARVTSMVAFAGPYGRPLLATGSDDQTLRVWDPMTSLEVRRLVTGAPIAALSAFAPAAGDPELIAFVGFGRLAVLDVLPAP